MQAEARVLYRDEAFPDMVGNHLGVDARSTYNGVTAKKFEGALVKAFGDDGSKIGK